LSANRVGSGTGPLWGMASSDLNARLLAWPARHELVRDTNSELDVLLIALEGDGVATIDGREDALVARPLQITETPKDADHE
jgi:hypothetical protein